MWRRMHAERDFRSDSRLPQSAATSLTRTHSLTGTQTRAYDPAIEYLRPRISSEVANDNADQRCNQPGFEAQRE